MFINSVKLDTTLTQVYFPNCYNATTWWADLHAAFLSGLLYYIHSFLQELVDVYVEYPFFVRGQGWSSCSPQRTARLCGLQCRQLSVGDVCLALTPVSTPSATLEPKTLQGKSVEERCELLQVPPPQVPPEPQRSAAGTKKEAEAVRRRHYSAPELRGPGTNCM